MVCIVIGCLAYLLGKVKVLVSPAVSLQLSRLDALSHQPLVPNVFPTILRSMIVLKLLYAYWIVILRFNYPFINCELLNLAFYMKTA
jgi:hypothetical protein